MAEEPRTDTPEVTEPAPGEGAATATAPEAEGEKKKLQQQVDISDVGPCKKHIKVTVERGDVDSRLDAKYTELVSDAQVHGFRPGKAPRKLVMRQFRKDVSDQVKAEVMLQSLEQLAEEYDIAPLSPPDLDPANIVIPDQGPLIYEFDVEVRPQFDLPNYKGLKLRRPVRTFTEADAADEERRLLSRYGQLIPKPEGNAQIGDYLIGDLTVQDGNRKLGELKETTFHVERQIAFKDGVADRFAEQVKGTNPGQTRTIDIKLSDNAADPNLRGTTVQGVLEVKDVKSVRLPELTHDLLHQFGVHTPEQLRERIRVLLERRLEYQQRQSARQQVLEQITAAANWELPNDLLARQARAALGRRVMEMRAGGMSDEEIQGRLRLLQQDVLRSTALALKEHFVLQKIAEVEKIEVGDDDINEEIQRLAYEENESPRRVRARLEKEELLESLAIELTERKVLDLIFQHAEYEDVQIGPQEQEARVATVEGQAVPGELHDPTQPPPTAEGESAGETKD
jgi:trigger factor